PAAGGQAPASSDSDVGLFAKIVETQDFLRVSDRDGRGYVNADRPMELKGDYHIEAPRTGGGQLWFPGGATVRMDPGSRLSWLSEELILEEGFFEIDAPTLFYARYLSEEEIRAQTRGTARLGRVTRTLDSCQTFIQATQRSRAQVLITSGQQPKLSVLSGDMRQGRNLLLPPRKNVSLDGLPKDLRPPTHMMPFPDHLFSLPLDDLVFMVDSLPGRGWEFELAKVEEFAEIFCRVRSPKNSIQIPPFPPGSYYWRVQRVNEDGLRTLASEPTRFEIQ
ncbi:MAG: hypothetical protein AB1405_16340, partial [Bdellovibrionota bacterium]